MSTDAIVLLKNDHKEILKTFRDFENAGENALKTKGKLVDKIIELLTVHTYIENEVMYPRVRELLPELEDDVLESYEEHHVADVLCMELAAMSPDDERFDANSKRVQRHAEIKPIVEAWTNGHSVDEIVDRMLAAGVPSAPINTIDRLVILALFLYEWRVALISVVAIPLSLMAAVLVLQWRGTTVNTMILAGFIVALGDVVDDAIIVVENIHRHIEAGLTPATAAP